jgi:hypothetical protein
MKDRWAPQLCTRSIACPRCGAPAGESCLSDRPLHLERWDAWQATGFLEPEPCPTCGKDIDCKCEPPVITATGGEICEGCGRGIPAGTQIYLFRDEDGDSVMGHVECPPRASA